MSCWRPSNASSRVTVPCGPASGVAASISTMGSRLRAAAIASPSWVCAFSRTRSLSSSAWKVARSVITGRVSACSFFTAVPLLVFRVGGFRESFDRGQPPVPLGREVGHGPGGLVEAGGLHLVENFPALLVPADQPGPFEHDQMLGNGLAGERHPPGQPAGADRVVADQKVEDLTARRVGDGRPQLVIDRYGHVS